MLIELGRLKRPPAAATATCSGKITPGGTVNVVANSGPANWDTVPAYYTADYEFERVYARQLVSYPTVPYTGTSGAGWNNGHHAGRRRGDQGPDHRQRRDQRRRQGVYLPHQAGR